MPKKLSDPEITPTLIQERLVAWGHSIRAARLEQRITVAELCQRVGISEATLRRLEHGDPGAAAGTYLTTLLTLGLFDTAAPALHASLGTATGHRVRLSKLERGEVDDHEF
jgi:transcriptional regulator with XRE-family HTH domain